MKSRMFLLVMLLAGCANDPGDSVSTPDVELDADEPDVSDAVEDESDTDIDVQLDADIPEEEDADPVDVSPQDASEDSDGTGVDAEPDMVEDTFRDVDSDSPLDASSDVFSDADEDPTSDVEEDAGSGCPGAGIVHEPREDLGALSFPPALNETWGFVSGSASSSSPTFFDLNADGALDILIGAGLEADVPEGIPAVGALIAVDGATGELIFEAPLRDESYTRPMLLATPDPCRPHIVVGGRNGTLEALTIEGERVWAFNGGDNPDAQGIFNFYTPQQLEDRTGDGFADLVIANGGDPTVGPGDPRPPGQLMVLDGRTGDIVARATTPDLAETYTSAALGRNAAGEEVVYFGTGGETNPGAFWVALVEDVLRNDISAAIQLLPVGERKGVIAPPSLVDLTGDGVLDVVVATFEGVAAAIDGATYEVLWSIATEDEWETYSAPGIGHFDADGVPDAFFSFSIGAFPTYFGTAHLAVSGATGEVILDRRTNDIFVNSPLLADLDGDGLDEVLMQWSRFIGRNMINRVAIYLPATGEVLEPEDTRPGAGTGTGAIIDLDGDGRLEWVMTARLFVGLASWQMWRVDLATLDPGGLRWAGYLGTGGDSTYRTDDSE